MTTMFPFMQASLLFPEKYSEQSVWAWIQFGCILTC